MLSIIIPAETMQTMTSMMQSTRLVESDYSRLQTMWNVYIEAEMDALDHGSSMDMLIPAAIGPLVVELASYLERHCLVTASNMVDMIFQLIDDATRLCMGYKKDAHSRFSALLMTFRTHNIPLPSRNPRVTFTQDVQEYDEMAAVTKQMFEPIKKVPLMKVHTAFV